MSCSHLNRPRLNIFCNLRQLLRMLATTLLLMSLCACVVHQKLTDRQVKMMQPAQVKKTKVSLKKHTARLAKELFESFMYAEQQNQQYRFAVATFVPVESMRADSKNLGPLRLLGHQLEQGMMTELAARGYVAQDYKATNSLIIDASSDRVFSRSIDELSKYHRDVDFYLSGTLTEAEQGVIVNARIIHVDSKDVLAAATRFIPDTVLWGAEQVTTRGGMIYRSSEE